VSRWWVPIMVSLIYIQGSGLGFLNKSEPQPVNAA